MAGAVAGTVRVTGLRELQRALKDVEKNTRRDLLGELKDVAEPVRSTAEQLAGREIVNLAATPEWQRMRIGVTTNAVYVAPKRRSRDRTRRRPKFGTMLLERAMIPALEQNRPAVDRALSGYLDHIERRFG